MRVLDDDPDDEVLDGATVERYDLVGCVVVVPEVPVALPVD